MKKLTLILFAAIICMELAASVYVVRKEQQFQQRKECREKRINHLQNFK